MLTHRRRYAGVHVCTGVCHHHLCKMRWNLRFIQGRWLQIHEGCYEQIEPQPDAPRHSQTAGTEENQRQIQTNRQTDRQTDRQTATNPHKPTDTGPDSHTRTLTQTKTKKKNHFNLPHTINYTTQRYTNNQILTNTHTKYPANDHYL